MAVNIKLSEEALRKLFFLIILAFFSVEGTVLTGLDTMENEKFVYLKNKKVAVLTNRTAVNKNGIPILELLKKHRINVTVIYTPEHGFKIDKDEKIGNSKFGQISVISLYDKNRKPCPLLLKKKADVIIYDIQDAGSRYYTYISTLAYMMEAAKKADMEIIVLDRPVIVGGETVSGFVPPKNLTGHFTSIFPIATRYGMTVGELALLFNKHFKINAKLTVVKLKNYKRSMLFDETGLPWISPSPNLTSLKSALLYSELGWLETVNLSFGRGTQTPFQMIGAPFVDGKKVVKELSSKKFKGLKIKPVTFTPKAKYHKHFGKKCGGIKIEIDDMKQIQGFKLGVEILRTMLKLYPDKIKISKDFALMSGSPELEKMIRNNVPFAEIEKKAEKSRKNFKKIRKKYLIY